jgi:hypothetical protein
MLYIPLCFLVFLVGVATTITASPSAEANGPDHQTCLAFGFNSADAMSCSVCETLLKVTGETQMHEECLQCCTSSANEIYELAVLEVDKKSAKRYLNIVDIMKRAEGINLVLRHRRGSPPTLLMYRERDDEEASERIGVTSWTADVLEEYIVSHTQNTDE